jgi:hypothetical protein
MHAAARFPVLRHSGTAKEKRQVTNDRDIVFHGNLFAMMTLLTAGPLGQGPRGIEIFRDGRSGSDHHQIDAPVFEAFPRQTAPFVRSCASSDGDSAKPDAGSEIWSSDCRLGAHFRLRSQKASFAVFAPFRALLATHRASIVPL